MSYFARTRKDDERATMNNKFVIAVLYSLLCGGIVFLLFEGNIFESMELKTLDMRFRLFADPAKASPDVVIAAIDENSLTQLKAQGHVWPWPRDFYAVLVDYFRRGHAKAVLFDILFPDPDIGHLTDSAETDGKFAAAIRRSGKVLLSVNLGNDVSLRFPDNALVWDKHYRIIPPGAMFTFPKYAGGVLPIYDFQKATGALGVANYQEDREDGTCRRIAPFLLLRDRVIPQIGVGGYLLANGVETIQQLSNGDLIIGDVRVPLDRKGNMMISWYGRGGPDVTFRYFSIAGLIQSAVNEERGIPPAVPSAVFKDKIVLIGSNASGLFDFRNTPFTRFESYPATEIHATVLSNLMQRDFLRRVPASAISCMIFLMSVFVCFSFLYVKTLRTVIIAVILVAGGWVGGAFALFTLAHRWLDIVAPEVCLTLAFVIAAVVSYQLEGKARRRLRDTFGRYMSPVVIREIIEKNQDVKLGGMEITGTVFFSDIKDFAKVAERLNPEQLVSQLNGYFSIVTDIILERGALLDKYIGDAVMAIFGAPLPVSDHAIHACTAALEIQQSLKDVWRGAGLERPEFITRIGLHSGSMIVGNVGSQQRLDFTAIGDSVNLASRLEGLNKTYGTHIIISETTCRDVHDRMVCRELDMVRVVGKQIPVHIYELIGPKEGPLPLRQNLIERFHEGLALYRARRFEKAREIFTALASGYPADIPTSLYLHRCCQYCAAPPPEDWDGVAIMQTK